MRDNVREQGEEEEEVMSVGARVQWGYGDK